MAAAYATCSLGYSTTIINRNEQKAREFAHRLRQNGLSDITAAGLDSFCKCFRRASVIIYNLPVTIPQIAELSNRDIKGGCLWRKDRKLILEANYKDPAFTPDLMESLRSANSRKSSSPFRKMRSAEASPPFLRISFFAFDSISEIRCRMQRERPEYACVTTASLRHLLHSM